MLPPDPRSRRDGRPWAYLITFSCYGARFHGNPSGSVDPRRNAFGSHYVEECAARERFERDAMSEAAYLLDAPRRRVVLETIGDLCADRGWNLHAAHVRTNHAHAVIQAEIDPETIFGQIKGRCARALTLFEGGPRRRWSRHASARWLWRPHEVDAAVEYVIKGQGEPMAAY